MVRQAWMRSAVASPITVEGRLWGAIAVFSPRLEPLPESTEARLADFTELVATAIANSEARDNLRELFDEQAALRRIATLVAVGTGPGELFAGLAEEVVRVLGVPTIMLARFEPEGVISRARFGQRARLQSRQPLAARRSERAARRPRPRGSSANRELRWSYRGHRGWRPPSRASLRPPSRSSWTARSGA